MKLDETLRRTERINSGLTEAESRLLYELAARAHRAASGSVVEIGSYTGKSTILMGATGHVFAVDHHRGNVEHQPGQPRCRPGTTIDGTVDTFPAFKRNLLDAGLWDRVTPVVTDHVSAAQVLTPAALPIELLFVDADHSEMGTRFVIEVWREKVSGLMAFHDYSPEFPGTAAAIEACGLGDPVEQVGTLAVFSACSRTGDVPRHT